MNASNCTSHFCFKDDDHPDEEITLDFEYPERNNGMLVILANDIVCDSKELVNSLSIFKPIYDARDAKSKKITASLLPDGTGILVREPTVPTYLLEINKEMKAACMKKEPSHQCKTVLLRFPEGTTCNDKHFNKNSLQLNNNLRLKSLDLVGKDPSKTMDSKVAYISWKVAIDGDTRDFNESDDEEEFDEWEDAFSKHLEGMDLSDEEHFHNT